MVRVPRPTALAARAVTADVNALAIERFLAQVRQALSAGTLQKLLLAHPQGGGHELEVDVQRVLVRPVQIRQQAHLSVLFRHPTKDITRNWPVDEGLALLGTWLTLGAFRNAHLHTPGQEVQLAFSKKGKATVRVGKASNAESATVAGQAVADGSHNREKHRLITLDRPFLRELGVTDAQGQLIATMSRKYKQINKFIEVLSAALDRSSLAQAQALHVVDFGSGKGYLTFAVHDWLRQQRQVQAQVTGVELRDELVQLCQGVIERLGLQGMAYEQGDVRDYHPATLDVMIALHACDIATDHAIHLGIRAGAEIILCSPCCHKEVRPQLLSPHPLKPILQHGIHLGQQAEMLTDGLRALLLDAAGYDTQVFEFISLEHTNKNKMILAVKRAQPQSNAEVLSQIRDLKAFYGLQTQCLETLLKAEGRIA